MAEVNTSTTGKDIEEVPEASKKGGPPKKSAKKKETVARTRVSQACDRCRDRKDRCDGKKPKCENCTANGRECSYDTNVKKRGLPEGYVRGMEKLWGLAIKEVDDVEENIMTALGAEEQQPAMWNDEGNSDNLVGLWRKSQISQKLEGLLSSMSLEPTTESAKRKRSASITQTSKKPSGAKVAQSYLTPQAENSMNDWAVEDFLDPGLDMGQAIDATSPMGYAPVNQSNSAPYVPATQSGTTTAVPSDHLMSILSPSNSNGRSAETFSVTTIPELPSETWHLLDVYFSYTHSWFPIIEKHDLLRISYQYSQRKVSPSDARSGDFAVLWAAIAYAKFQHRAINNIPRALGPVGEKVWTAEKMYAQARAFIPAEDGIYELGHVQALLILTLANIGTDHLSRAWFLIGQAVRAAIELRLDQSSESMLAVPKSKSRAKHVYLGCFVLDTLVAARLGRRPHIRSAEVDIVGLLEEDGLEEWDPWTDCLNVRRSSTTHSRFPAAILSTFNKLVQVLQILNEASCTTSKSPAIIRQNSAEFVERLHAWTRTQSSPSHFDMDAMQSMPAISLLPHQYHLHTVFSSTLATSHLLSADHNTNSLEPAAKSAKRTTDLLSQYSNTFGLLIVPPTYEYYIKTAYDVVNAVQSSIDHTHLVINDFRRSLDYCLECAEPAWPILETYRNSVSSPSSLQRRESQVAFDLISGSNHSNHDAASPHPNQISQSINQNNYISPSQPSPQTISQGQSSQAQQFPTTTQRASSFGQSSTHGLPQNPLNIYENAHATFGMGNPPHSAREGFVQFPPTLQSLARANMQFQPRLRNSRSTEVDITGEPVFGDLMRLDATEWYIIPIPLKDKPNLTSAK